MGLHAEAIKSILLLSKKERLEYSIKCIVGNQMIYTLNEDEDWTILYDSNEAGYLAIFPEYDLALLSLEWISDADGVDEIELENFLVDTIPLMLEQNIKIAVFPLNENVESIILDPIEFAKMINAHFSEWYSETFDLPYLS